MDVQPAQHPAAAGDARRRGRRDVRDQRESVLCAGCRIGPGDLALLASANQGAHRQCGRRRQPRRSRRRRPRVHGHRSRAHHRAESLDRSAAVGNRDGGLAPELQRHRCAARGWKPRHLRLCGRRRRRARVPGRVRSSHRQRGMAILDRACARGTWIRDVAGRRHRASGSHNLADRHVRRRARHHLLAHRESHAGFVRRRSPGRQPVLGLNRRAGCEDRKTQMAFPVHAA